LPDLNQFSQNEVKIPLSETISLRLISETLSQENPPLLELTSDDIIDGEELIQLLEGRTYEYELTEGYELERRSKIIHPSRGTNNQHRGRITTSNYVGRLALKAFKQPANDHDEELTQEYNFAVEVRSLKADYRSDYRVMLQDITNECVDLLMQHSSPVTQQVTVDHTESTTTLYQRFAFVKSIIDSNEFRDAINRIIAMPKTHWKSHEQECDIRRVGRIGSKQAKQIASRSDRINLSENHSLSTIMSSIPTRLIYSKKIDSLDTPENRFIKHALQTFKYFCSELCGYIEEKHSDETKHPFIYQEAKKLEQRFSEYLSHNMFKEVQRLSTLPLNSPVLQRKEGYREVLRVWLMFDLAAKLVWKAPDNESYQVGKRDVATLYEYWLFFKLLRLIEDLFEINPKDIEQLIEPTSDGLGLKLKEGKLFAVDATYFCDGRNLRVRLSYNKTFSKSDYPNSGSWTQQMRPDYTLSIWPEAFSESEAEKQELIVHVHFDAKYRVEGLKYLTSDISIDLDAEKVKQKEGTYKRADLLKMHAYKDAIRRTVGAYVLYPGTKSLNQKGFHEIVPGLGAFPVCPSNTQNDLVELKNFILTLVQHFSNRASQREQISFHQYDILKDPPSAKDVIKEAIPEYSNLLNVRANPPSETSVLIAYVKTSAQKNWIDERGFYNIRMDDKGLKKYGIEEASVKYILLREKGEESKAHNIWKVIDEAPKIVSKNSLLTKFKYPVSADPKSDFYLLYKIEKIVTNDFGNQQWNIANLINDNGGTIYERARPFAVSMTELTKCIVNK